jgi:NAD-dependent SIR2 family protein deacetylase
MAQDTPAAVAALTELVAAGGVTVLTGAGISTDSGLPDYRDASGRARHASPMTYDRFRGSADERQRYWARSHLGWPRFAAARPNRSHHVVADLEAVGLVDGVITQNVDRLHSAAGSREVIDLHGRLDAVVCLGCGVRRPRVELGLRLDVLNPGFGATVRAGQPARPDGDVVLADEVTARFRVVACRQCDGVLKPDVVFFGEPVPRDRIRASLDRLEQARSLLVLGTSLAVGSGYRMVTAAKRRGLPVAIVTRGVTRGDRHADLRLDADLRTTLGEVARGLGRPDQPPVRSPRVSRARTT